MGKHKVTEGTCTDSTIGNLLKLKSDWEKTKSENEKEKYMESLKHFNSKLLQDEEI